ncbi:MAG: GAF domain-containing protein, partial [Microthrixaceae bacterium]
MPHPLDTPREPRIDAESRRVDAVRRLGLIGSDRDEHLDRLTRVTAQALDVECAYLTVIDEDHQWIQSCSRPGHDRRTSLATSFCDTAIRGDDRILIVPDARADERFASFSNVATDGGIRFYAGRVVRSPGGYAIGTLCVTDSEPREPRDADLALLDDLGAMVEQELVRIEHLQVLGDVDASERVERLVLDTLSEGVVLQDAQGRILECNPAAE